MTTAKIAYQLQFLGRTNHRRTAYVAYADGAYRHIVRARYWDAALPTDLTPTGDDETDVELYSAWCGRGHDRGMWADDDTARRVAIKLGLAFVHSATDGTCSRLDAADAGL